MNIYKLLRYFVCNSKCSSSCIKPKETDEEARKRMAESKEFKKHVNQIIKKNSNILSPNPHENSDSSS